jgi:hypothetical protein
MICDDKLAVTPWGQGVPGTANGGAPNDPSLQVTTPPEDFVLNPAVIRKTVVSFNSKRRAGTARRDSLKR